MNWKSRDKGRLLAAILALETADEAARFLRDLLTRGEIEELTKRLRAAEMLTEGRSYAEIEKETGFSSTTVARVSKWLNRGKGGYKAILAKLHRHNPIRARRGLS